MADVMFNICVTDAKPTLAMLASTIADITSVTTQTIILTIIFDITWIIGLVGPKTTNRISFDLILEFEFTPNLISKANLWSEIVLIYTILVIWWLVNMTSLTD